MTTAALADELPANYLGNWQADIHNQMTIGPRSLEAPGALCKFTSIKAKDQNPFSDTNERVFIVDMTCGLEDARRPVRQREIFSMRSIGSENVLIEVNTSQPRIDVWRRTQTGLR
jgi:hypothetical protein